ncbi:MAG: radical SAM protein [Candidatus Thermoplasmatota archaeon]
MKKFYYPGDKFPSVSITGRYCALSCPHCEGRFLKGMKAISNPGELYDFAVEHDRSGGNGFLLSGGFTEEGYVPLENFFDVLSKIKETTSLEINVHTGIPTEEIVEGLISSSVDAVSYDMIGSQETIARVYGLNVTPEDYKHGYEMLKKRGLKVVPHITVGLNRGEIDGEFKALEMLETPSTLVLNTLIPGDFGERVEKEDLLAVMDHVSERTEVILGCMRERGRSQLEIEALERGAEGVVIPSIETVDWAEKRFDIKRLEKCCVL